jgi:large subunit ribosomal protein L25
MQKVSLRVSARDTEKKGEVKELRRQGFVPGVLYGLGSTAKKVRIDLSELCPVLKKSHGTTLLIDLDVEGEKEPVTTVIREVQLHPVSREILHCDFLRVDMTRKYLVTVPVIVAGEAVGVKVDGGVLDQHLREIEIRCLPGEIPESYTLDVSHLQIGDTIMVEEIQPLGQEEFVTHADVAVVSVAAPRKLAEVLPAEEAEEEVEGEEKPEGEEEAAEGEEAEKKEE